MAKSTCPSCGLSAISLKTHLKRGPSPPWLRCQACDTALRHPPVSLLLGLAALAMIVPSAIIATISIDRPMVPPSWFIYTTIVAGLGLLVGSVLGASHLSWRFVPLVPLPAEWVAVLESQRRPLKLALGSALLPAAFVGLLGFFSGGPDGLLAAAVSFAIVWVTGIALLVTGGVYLGPDSRVHVSPWFLAGVLGAYLLYFFSNTIPVVAVGVFLWPALVGGVWYLRRRWRDRPAE